MTIPDREKIIAIAIPSVLFVGFLIFTGYGWLQEHDARLQAETQTGQQQKQIDGLKQQQAATQNALTRQLTALERMRQTPATASQMVSDARTLLPGLPVPLQVETGPRDASLPNAPSAQSIVIPEADFKSIQDAQITCEESAAKLATCQSLGDNDKKQIQLAEQQRDEWKTAAKGGSVWHRALGAAKWFGVGAGAGAGLYAVAHHK